MTAGAERYTVEAVTEQGVTVSCTTNDTYCALYNMACGQVYNINVTASNHVCQDVSTSTQSVSIMTGEEEKAHVDDEPWLCPDTFISADNIVGTNESIGILLIVVQFVVFCPPL